MVGKFRPGGRWLASAALVPMLIAATASAQTAKPAAEAASGSGGVGVTEVVVTATRRNEALSKVPAVTTVFWLMKFFPLAFMRQSQNM